MQATVCMYGYNNWMYSALQVDIVLTFVATLVVFLTTLSSDFAKQFLVSGLKERQFKFIRLLLIAPLLVVGFWATNDEVGLIGQIGQMAESLIVLIVIMTMCFFIGKWNVSK